MEPATALPAGWNSLVPGVYHDPGDTVLASSDTLEVEYTVQFPIDVTSPTSMPARAAGESAPSDATVPDSSTPTPSQPARAGSPSMNCA